MLVPVPDATITHAVRPRRTKKEMGEHDAAGRPSLRSDRLRHLRFAAHRAVDEPGSARSTDAATDAASPAAPNGAAAPAALPADAQGSSNAPLGGHGQPSCRTRAPCSQAHAPSRRSGKAPRKPCPSLIGAAVEPHHPPLPRHALRTADARQSLPRIVEEGTRDHRQSPSSCSEQRQEASGQGDAPASSQSDTPAEVAALQSVFFRPIADISSTDTMRR